MTWTKSRNALVLAFVLATLPHAAIAQTVTKLIVVPIQFRLETGGKGQIVVDVQDETGRAMSSEAAGVRFQTSDPGVVTVSETGAVRAAGVGKAEIVVRAGNKSRRIPVTVEQGATPVVPAPASAPAAPATPAVTPPVTPPPSQPVAPTQGSNPPAPAPSAGGAVPMSASIEPVNIQLLPSERFRPTFRVHYADGTQAESREVVWTTFGAAIGFDAASGEVVGVAPGSGVLGARLGSSTISASVTVTVGEPNLVPTPDSLMMVTGEQDTVHLVAPAQGRRRVTQNLVWRTTDPSILRVLNPAAGIVVAQLPGSTDLIVDGYSITRRIPVKVAPRIVRIETTAARGAAITIGTGSVHASNPRAIGTDGSSVTGSVMTWRVADTTIARVDASGLVTGLREGRTTLTLDVPGLELSSWPVTVQPAKVTISANRIGLPIGTTRKLVASLKGADGHDFGPAPITRWTSSAPAIATIDGAGVVTAHRTGRTAFVAAADGAGADSVVVYVTGRGLVSGTIAGMRGVWQLLTVGDTVPALLLQPTNGTLTQAVWSPDRTRIAATFEPLDKPNLTSVVVMDADGTNLSTLSPDTAIAFDPAWSRDGASVVMAARDPKSSSIIRVALAGKTSTVVATSTESKFRYPFFGADTGTVLARLEMGGVVDVARLRNGVPQLLTTGKPREELVTALRDGRLLIAVDSSSRTRPNTLQWATVAEAGLQSATPVRIPQGLTIVSVSPGYDDATVIVVARVRSWPGASGAALVVLRVALDGAEPTTLLLLSDKDNVTVRSN